ncbi:unnamed protein product [Prorocentrum cordatum]|uniref:SET domain-containing protein n=1 Tax=Prorocentrum cordatum TaxID=2364126 RepID=A0ABN9RLP0_9DINO|nr:unnamed protein product [Polarella glacialis]
MSEFGLEEKVGMAAGALPAAWRPSRLRAQEILALGASAARRAARLRRQHACEAALRKFQADGLVAPGSWRDREIAARPALMLLAEGLPVPGGQRRRRNAAWHAARVPARGFARASPEDLAWDAAGPRLECQFVKTGGIVDVPFECVPCPPESGHAVQCLAEATPVLAPGAWLRSDPIGEADEPQIEPDKPPDGDSGSLEGPQADAEVIQGFVEESSESIVKLDLERQDSEQKLIEYLEWVALSAAALKRLCSKGHVLDRDSNPFDDPLPCAACGIMIPVDGAIYICEALLCERFDGHPHWRGLADGEAYQALLEPSGEGAHARLMGGDACATHDLVAGGLAAEDIAPVLPDSGLFLAARLCLLTREFGTPHGSALVPVVDLCNHSSEPGVHQRWDT